MTELERQLTAALERLVRAVRAGAEAEAVDRASRDLAAAVGLTRFRGHLTPVEERVHDAEHQEALSARVS